MPGAEIACVVLSFRDEPGLVEAVRSLVDQSASVEVVVVNSGGGDPAGRIAAAGLDVPVFSRSERLYPGAVRNIGIQATSAPFVAFLAADCIAQPGWIEGRLAQHRSGAAAVASTLTNAYPESTAAWASLLLLHNRLLTATGPRQRLFYGLSYDRTLFERYGCFREDLRAGEDTEFNSRFGADCSIVAARDVRTAHRYPTTVLSLLRDAYRRGRLQAAMAGLIHGGRGGRPRSLEIVSHSPSIGLSILRCVLRSPGPERARLVRALPLASLGGVFYATGAATAAWRPYDGQPDDGGGSLGRAETSRGARR